MSSKTTSRSRSKASNKDKNNQNKNSVNSRRPKTIRNTNATPKWRVVHRVLSDITNLVVIPRSDAQLVNAISGESNIAIISAHRHSPNMLRTIRTLGALGTKLKDSSPRQSKKDQVAEFEEIQKEEIMISAYYAKKARKQIKDWFIGFDYNLTEDQKPMVTAGSSFPKRLAPKLPGQQQLHDLMYYDKRVFEPGFSQFREYTEELYSDGKISIVAKNYLKGRMITVASCEMIAAQYELSERLRHWISTRTAYGKHIVQFSDQTVQHQMLKPGNATIDLSSASDRIYLSVVQQIWPEILRYSELYPEIIEFEDKTIPLTCIGTQGFPLTFTIMSIVLGAIAASAKQAPTMKNPNRGFLSSNYGDDFVVHTSDFEEVFTAFQSLGSRVNIKKSFRSTRFLESCGLDVTFDSSQTARNIAPVHLRGESDVNIILFATQLYVSGLISYDNALILLKKTVKKFFAFEHAFQLTPFHFPFGKEVVLHGIKRKIRFNAELQYKEILVPTIVQRVEKLRTLSKSDSKLVIQLDEYDRKIKNYGLLHIDDKGHLVDLASHPLYTLYVYTTNYGIADPLSNETCDILEQYKTSLKILAHCYFIMNEVRKYRYAAQKEFFKHEYIPTAETVKNYSNLLSERMVRYVEPTYPFWVYKQESGMIFIPDSTNVDVRVRNTVIS